VLAPGAQRDEPPLLGEGFSLGAGREHAAKSLP